MTQMTVEELDKRDAARTAIVAAAVATADRILMRDADTPEELMLRTALVAAAFVSKLGTTASQLVFKQEHGLTT